jgi:hypothetical protein
LLLVGFGFPFRNNRATWLFLFNFIKNRNMLNTQALSRMRQTAVEGAECDKMINWEPGLSGGQVTFLASVVKRTQVEYSPVLIVG